MLLLCEGRFVKGVREIIAVYYKNHMNPTFLHSVAKVKNY
jgi:hypothetical protein